MTPRILDCLTFFPSVSSPVSQGETLMWQTAIMQCVQPPQWCIDWKEFPKIQFTHAHTQKKKWGRNSLGKRNINLFHIVWHRFNYEVFVNVQSIRPLDCQTYNFESRLSFAEEKLLLSKIFYVNCSRIKVLRFP